MSQRKIGLLLSVFAALWGSAAAEEPITLRVMTFNVWYGGEQVSLPKVAEAIRAADADIVGVQESDGNLYRIAEAAGMPYVDPRRRIISRWPIFDSGVGERTDKGVSPYSTTGLDLGALHAWVMVRPGKVVAMANVHLTSDPSGLELARTGGRLAEVLALENRTRAAEVKPLTGLAKVAADGTPVFLTGDFNTPSHLDWTDAAHRSLPDIPYVVVWPTTRLLADAGLRDSFREAHPDPVAEPGITWTPGTPNPVPPPSPGLDRIDFIFSAGRTTTLASRVVGEQGGPDVGIGIFPWPSDHRAVVSTFKVIPSPAPAMLSVTPRRVLEGDTFLLRTYDPTGDRWNAAILRRSGEPKDALIAISDLINGYQRTIRLGTQDLAPGNYDALLISHDRKVLKRHAFTVAPAGSKPGISLLEPSVKRGAPIRFRWHDTPGDLRDWVGIYAAGDPDAMRYLGFAYTEAMFDGEGSIQPDVDHGSLAPGEYELRLMHDETYVTLSKVRFTVRP